MYVGAKGMGYLTTRWFKLFMSMKFRVTGESANVAAPPRGSRQDGSTAE